ncbi:hypothetical protein [Streptomyces sp. NPDC056669]|uniref:aggregation-promoting factor C-terminal-like domain-containing protein n=1 Tax=Streptomyces sp. NPDC056669 TaxID=3345903 RepID=UPI0036890030
MQGIGDESDKITRKFDNWGKSLKGSPDFERFLDYVKETAPGLGQFLKDVLRTMVDVAQAASPLSSTMFAVLGPLLDGISWLANNAPWAVQLMWGMYLASKALSLLMPVVAAGVWLYNTAVGIAALETFSWAAALQVTGIVPAITAIILVVGALVLGVMYAWKKSEGFRDVVKGVWSAISSAASTAWKSYIQPVLVGLWGGMKWVGDKVVWLWTNAFQPALKWISDALKFFVTLVLTIVITPIYLAIKALGAIALWLWTDGFRPMIDGISRAFKLLWEKVIAPIFGWIGDKAKWLYDKAIKPAFHSSIAVVDDLGDKVRWLWDKGVKPVFNWIGDKAEWLYNKAVKPWLNKLRDLIGKVADSFSKAKKDIKTAWDEVSGIVMAPVKIIVDVVYNRGIRPVWNSVAKVVGAEKLDPVNMDSKKKYNTGGVVPGYMPGVDNTIIAVGGGEAVMRPEWTRAVGADYVHSMNAAARNGGVGAVQRMVNAGTPAFADGGIVDWLSGKVKGAASFLKRGWDMVSNPSKIFNAAKDWALSKLKKFGDNEWVRAMVKLPVSMFNSLKSKAVDWLWGGPGNAEGKVLKALTWAKAQAGKPYQWGGAGNPSFDCSGYMGSIQKVIEGKNPKGRIWSTMAFHGDTAPKGWVRNLAAPFQIGITNKGVGHTAGTLAGVNVESRGGQGVIVGKAARGAHHPMFDAVYGFRGSIANHPGSTTTAVARETARQMLGKFGFSQKQWPALRDLWQHESGWKWNARNVQSGAYGIPQSLPAEKMASSGADWLTNPATQIDWGLGYIKKVYGSPSKAWAKWQSRSPNWYDDGGYLPPGLSLVANGTGKPEPVFTATQWDTLRSNAGNGRGTPNIVVENTVLLGTREITDIVDERHTIREDNTARAISVGRW